MAEIVQFQPVLPLEGQWTQAEQNYVDDEPPGLFPENQDSNWGLQRQIFSKQQQDLIDQMNVIYSELFVKTSSVFLDVWEAQLGLPIAPAGVSDANRRTRIQARLKKGAFTDALRASIIEPFLTATFGETVTLVPEGIALTATGIALYGESVSVTHLYRVYDDIENFSYQVWIPSTNTPDITSLTRELQRITPAGISFIIDNSKANILDYDNQVLHDGPHGYWKLGANANGSSSIALNGTVSGSVTFGAATLPQNTTEGGATFSAAGSGLISVPDNAALAPAYAFTLETWVKPTSLSQAGIVGKLGSYWIEADATGKVGFHLESTAGNTITVMTDTPVLVAGQTKFIRVVFTGKVAEIWVNGVLVKSAAFDGPVKTAANPFTIGGITGRGFFNGVLDEAVLYNVIVAEEKPYDHYSVGINQL